MGYIKRWIEGRGPNPFNFFSEPISCKRDQAPNDVANRALRPGDRLAHADHLPEQASPLPGKVPHALSRRSRGLDSHPLEDAANL
jgi:hypothetical protein